MRRGSSNRYGSINVYVPVDFADHTNGLLGQPGRNGTDFTSLDGQLMQTCSGTGRNPAATYAFGDTWKASSSLVVSTCAVDICPFKAPASLPTTIPPAIQIEIDRVCAGLRGDLYNNCAFDYYFGGSNGTTGIDIVDRTIALSEIVININVVVNLNAVTVSWTVISGYDTYLVEYTSVGTQYWIELDGNSNPLTVTLGDGSYIFRVCVSSGGTRSPWSLSVQINVNIIQVNYTLPYVPVIIGGQPNTGTGGGHGGSGNNIGRYYDGSGQEVVKNCNCADGQFIAPEEYQFSTVINTVSMLVLISANAPINASTAYCRIAGIVVRSSQYTNETIYCPLFLGTAPATIEFSVNDGAHYYVLKTVAVPTNSPYRLSYNQLQDNSFYIGWTGIVSDYVDVILFVQGNQSLIVQEYVAVSLRNYGSMVVNIPVDSLVAAVRVQSISLNGTASTWGVISVPTPPICNWKYCGSQPQCIGQPAILTSAPSNNIDAVCQRHDVCTQQGVMTRAACNAQLLTELRDALGDCATSQCQSDLINYGKPVDNFYTKLYLTQFVQSVSTYQYYTAHSTGDPHLYTFNKCAYDFMV